MARWWAADLQDGAVAATAPDDVHDGEHLERASPPPAHNPAMVAESPDDDEGSDAAESLKLLAAGGVAGAVSKTATAPLARLTILYQVQGVASSAASGAAPSPIAGMSLPAALRAVCAREGAASLWRGNGVTILHRLPYSAVNFWAYERLTEAWLASSPPGGGGAPHADTLRRLACGGAAGMAACALAYPLDLVRTRLAAAGGAARPTVGAALAAILAADGPRGLYRGLGATLAQVGPSLALNYTAYGALRSRWADAAARRTPPGSPRSPPSPLMSLACGAAAGLLSSTATFPLDLVRRRMQLAEGARAGSARAGGATPPRPTYAAVVRDVLKRAGPAGFYAGIVPEYVKVAPGVAIAFCAYEAARDALGVAPGAAFR